MRHARTIGIDYRAGSLRVGEAERPAPEGLLLPENGAEAQRMIVRYVAETGLAGIPAALGIPAENVYLSLLKIPPGTRRSREDAVEEHLERLYALSGGETVSDVAAVPSRGRQQLVLVGVARLDTVRAQVTPLHAAGLNIMAAVPVSLAFFNYAAQKTAGLQVRLVVLCPVAGTGIEVLCGAGGTLAGIWRIPVSGNTPESAEEDPALAALGTDIASAWSALQAPSSPPPAVVWCGEAPLPAALARNLAAVIGARPVSLAEWRSDVAPRGGGPMLPLALAHSLHGRRGAHLNLLPTPMRERVLRKAMLPYQAAAAVFFAAFAGTLCWSEARRSEDLRHRLQSAETVMREREELLGERQKLAAVNAVLEPQVAALRDSAMSPLHTRELLVAIAEAKSPDDWIVCIADAQSYFAAPPPAATGKADEDAPPPFEFRQPTFIVEGYTPGLDLSSVRSFIETLRLHPQVAAVDLLGDDRAGPNPVPESFAAIPRVQRFVLEIRIREP